MRLTLKKMVRLEITPVYLRKTTRCSRGERRSTMLEYLSAGL